MVVFPEHPLKRLVPIFMTQRVMIRIPQAIRIATTIEQVVTDSDLVLVLTEWPEFTRANWASLIGLMNEPRVVDARNVLDRKEMIELGYLYDDLGRI